MARRKPVLITDAEDPERELRRREARYITMMGFRVLCLVGAAVLVAQKPPLWQVWAALCAVGAVLIPWFAVILANDRPAKRRRSEPPPPGTHAPPPLEPREHKVIDQEQSR